ncbi:lytic transglycosylase domain-containing protein [Candidatus Nitrospira nitrificans]|uniref:Putative Soluble lytic murein transglycosylase n=1 Tax=Candidatus Nitrospira nitrificans TaxID=1742973 RepID=A0A0S4LQP4_9BACT|nr:transglycosylase SLT domain-containing protein [Candidatus Nitrospira nitrificans]CUS37410.1 putative Soluble lytic murein transglycosylase [Candidatus Nitrospira nitrificans]
MSADASRQTIMKISTKYHSIRGCGLAVASSLALVLGGVLSCDGYAAQVETFEQPAATGCPTAEECFMAAAWPKERLGQALTKEQGLALKLERLRKVTEGFPGTQWAKRAGLLSGVLLIDRNPAAALPFLRAAQRDFVVLDDYIRFWIGEALLRLGEAKEAAGMFEGVPQAVPDSNLLNQVALRAGEAWYQASSCPEALSWFTKVLTTNDKDPQIPQAWLRSALCSLRENKLAEGQEILKQLWTKFPQTKEAKEAETLLASNNGGGWTATPDTYYERAQAFLGQSLHAEAIEELKKFLARDPASPHRGEARLKLGIAQVRLKLYDQARDTFHALTAEQEPRADEATVWLARVYLRQGLGEKLLDLCRTLLRRTMTPEQKGQIHLFAGIWLEDEARFDEAVARYRQVAKLGEPASQRTEAQWREGWVLYRTARYQEAISVWQQIVDQKDSDLEPQALYWIARSYGHVESAKSKEVFALLCQRFPYTYYCQLAREQTGMSVFTQTKQESSVVAISSTPSASDVTQTPVQDLQASNRMQIELHPSYRRAVELRTLGLEQDAARELGVLTDRYSRDPEVVAALSIMLNEVGAYHQALRLVRSRFREKLERTGGIVAEGLWNVAYPTGLIPTIKLSGANGVDPFLVAAIIREESQYDRRAVSRVGAIGLMQVMPATANAVAQQHRLPSLSREDLFDQETNIRIGARYVEQLFTQFSGNVVQVIAAYNAGPIVVGTWAAAYRGRSEDEFVELIHYQETRQYVKRVLRSYKEYLRLAGHQKVVS